MYILYITPECEEYCEDHCHNEYKIYFSFLSKYIAIKIQMSLIQFLSLFFFFLSVECGFINIFLKEKTRQLKR